MSKSDEEMRREEEMKDENSKHGSRWRWTSSPGMKSMTGSATVVPPARDRWDSQSEVKGQRGWSHPHRCQHKHSTP